MSKGSELRKHVMILFLLLPKVLHFCFCVIELFSKLVVNTVFVLFQSTWRAVRQ